MKRMMVYIMLLGLLAGILGGCGRMDGTDTAVSPSPAVSASPLMPSPDMDDGIVQDNDGFISDDDTGHADDDATGMTGEENQGTRPSASASPSASPSAAPGRNG